MANDLLVACPMQLTTTVKTLSIASNKPVSQQENTGTNFISWLYTDVTGTTSCTNGTRTELDDGMPLWSSQRSLRPSAHG